MARPRKMKRRDKSGKILRPTTRAEREDRVKPTPELLRHKRAVDGKEPEDPLSYLGFEAGLLEALDAYRRSKKACGFSTGSLVAQIDDTPRVSVDQDLAEADEMNRRARFEAAANTLLMDTRRGYEAVQDFCAHWGGPWKGCEVNLLSGAASLAEHYHIKLGTNFTKSGSHA